MRKGVSSIEKVFKATDFPEGDFSEIKELSIGCRKKHTFRRVLNLRLSNPTTKNASKAIDKLMLRPDILEIYESVFFNKKC